LTIAVNANVCSKVTPTALVGTEANVIVFGPIVSSTLTGLPKEIHSVVVTALDVLSVPIQLNPK